MGIIRDSFVMFKNWTESIEALPEEYQLECYKAVAKYGLTGVIPDGISPVAKAILISFSAGMENNIARYNASVENGKKGGRPKKEEVIADSIKERDENLEKPKKTQNNLDEPTLTEANLDEPTRNLYVNDNVNVNVNDNLEESKKERIKELKKCVRTRESYQELMDRMQVSKELQKFLWEFIRHSLLNKCVITNDKLERLINCLFEFRDDEERERILLSAIDKGHVDIFREKTGTANGSASARFENQREYSQEYFDSLITKISELK